MEASGVESEAFCWPAAPVFENSTACVYVEPLRASRLLRFAGAVDRA